MNNSSIYLNFIDDKATIDKPTYNLNFDNFYDNINYNYYHYKNTYSNTYDFTSIFLQIYMADKLLKIIFGSKARWFQLHAVFNIITSYNVLNSVFNIIKNPETGYELCKDNYNSLIIICLHLYHLLVFKNLKFYDYFHHILFVCLGVCVDMKYVKYNQKNLAYVVASGIPGIIEYTTLSLYKNDKITLKNQKAINSYIYNFLRYPFCVFAVGMNYNGYINGYIKDNFYPTIYVNFLLFLNGAIFNYLTLESYFCYKMNNKISYSQKKIN